MPGINQNVIPLVGLAEWIAIRPGGSLKDVLLDLTQPNLSAATGALALDLLEELLAEMGGENMITNLSNEAFADLAAFDASEVAIIATILENIAETSIRDGSMIVPSTIQLLARLLKGYASPAGLNPHHEIEQSEIMA
ncbi:MAG: hypothetical protein PHT60_14125 [Acidiphilium sp.]|nr:hypothetical protein [Acidiphilium sp.]MDD4936902.1 hypothetical protein [Acidiphilium sp.]